MNPNQYPNPNPNAQQMPYRAPGAPTTPAGYGNQYAPQNRPPMKKSPWFGGETFDMFASITFVGAVLMIIGVYVPFASYFGSGITLLNNQAAGAFFLIMPIIVSLLALFNKHYAALVAAVLTAVLSIPTLIITCNYFSDNSSNISFSAGLWLIIIGVIILLIGTIVSFLQKTGVITSAKPAAPYAPPQFVPQAQGQAPSMNMPPYQAPQAPHTPQAPTVPPAPQAQTEAFAIYTATEEEENPQTPQNPTM